MPATSTAAFFEVDIRCVCPERSCLVVRERMRHLDENVNRLLRLADEKDILRVSTACVNAGPVGDILDPDHLVVRMDSQPEDWIDRLPSARKIFLEKTTLGDRDLNIEHQAYNVFKRNPNTCDLLRRLDVRLWYVFGDALDYCFRTAVEGLLSLGFEVAMVTDTVGTGIDPPEKAGEVYALLEVKGARRTSRDEIVNRFAAVGPAS